MTMNFGQLSFSKDTQPVIGLPLEVIDKVGTTLAQSYHRNRTAASQQQKEVLNLPDSNSDVNKKIIQDISTGIKSKFEKFAKDDSWFDADNAVYQTAEELTSDTRVKDLLKYNAQYAKIDKDIEDSKASDYYQSLQREMNQQVNKGIRDENGNPVGYKGSALPGDLNVDKYSKQINDYITNWKADKQTYLNAPSSFNMANASNEFKELYMAYGKTSIESVDENAVRKFVYNKLGSDPSFNNEINKISELNLFARTGKLEADANDVTGLMIEQARYNPGIANQLIASSKEFADETSKMNTKQKNEYITHIINDPSLKQKYIASGTTQYITDTENTLGKKSNVYKAVYSDFTRAGIMQSFEGLIDKVSYINKDMDMSYVASSLNGERFKQFNLNNLSTPITYPTGQINAEAMSANVDTRETLQRSLSGLEMSLEHAKGTPGEGIIRKQYEDMKSQLTANDAMINYALRSIGYDDKTIIASNKSVIEGAINGAGLPSKYKTWGPDITMTNEESEKIYNAYLASNGNKTLFIKNASNISGQAPLEQLGHIYDTVSRLVADRTQDILQTRAKDIKSLPIIGIGDMGTPDVETKQLNNFIINRYLAKNGDFTALVGDDNFKSGTTNATSKEEFTYPFITGKNSVAKPKVITMTPVMFNSDSSITSSIPTFEVRVQNPDGTTSSKIVQYTGDVADIKEIYAKSALKAAVNAVSNTKELNSISARTSQTLGGYMSAGNRVIAINGETVSDLTLGGIMTRMMESGNLDDYITYSSPAGDMTVVTTKNSKGELSTDIYPGKHSKKDSYLGEPYLSLPNVANPTTFMESLGGMDLLLRAKTAEEYNAIRTIFKLNLNKK